MLFFDTSHKKVADMRLLLYFFLEATEASAFVIIITLIHSAIDGSPTVDGSVERFFSLTVLIIIKLDGKLWVWEIGVNKLNSAFDSSI